MEPIVTPYNSRTLIAALEKEVGGENPPGPAENDDPSQQQLGPMDYTINTTSEAATATESEAATATDNIPGKNVFIFL